MKAIHPRIIPKYLKLTMNAYCPSPPTKLYLFPSVSIILLFSNLFGLLHTPLQTLGIFWLCPHPSTATHRVLLWDIPHTALPICFQLQTVLMTRTLCLLYTLFTDFLLSSLPHLQTILQTIAMYLSQVVPKPPVFPIISATAWNHVTDHFIHLTNIYWVPLLARHDSRHLGYITE